jgi:hypothetical protein
MSSTARATIFRLPDPACVADINCDAQTDFYDVSLFLVAYINQNPGGDLNYDGVWNFYDVSAFLTAFHAGCFK